MTSENTPPDAAPEEAPASKTAGPVSVSKCGLELVSVRLRLLVVAPGDPHEDIPPTANITRQGLLVPDSHTPEGFRAAVSWALEYPEGVTPPITITGKHELVLSLKEAISPQDAEYYAEVNAVIFAFPYVRQLIDDLTAKSLGRNIMIRPLDVPQFVQECVKEKLRRSSQDRDEREAKVDAQDRAR